VGRVLEGGVGREGLKNKNNKTKNNNGDRGLWRGGGCQGG
jgi:hypothetical protein